MDSMHGFETAFDLADHLEAGLMTHDKPKLKKKKSSKKKNHDNDGPEHKHKQKKKTENHVETFDEDTGEVKKHKKKHKDHNSHKDHDSSNTSLNLASATELTLTEWTDLNGYSSKRVDEWIDAHADAAPVGGSRTSAELKLNASPTSGAAYVSGSTAHKTKQHRSSSTAKRISKKQRKLKSAADVFAEREGKTLTWSNVDMTLAGKDGDKRLLLDDVWGEVPAKQTTAIMGPSGAGKTSLLNILAGRAVSRGKVEINADVRLNNYTVDPTNVGVRQQIAFVAQDDSLQVTSTPREAIRFSARLRLPRSTTPAQIEALTDSMLTELGLADCADTIVGGTLIKGISGGQRKRTSVGVELVTKPPLVFLDEPTSGLDSFSAVQLCQVLKKVANAGSSVLFTIHQPSSEIFNSFDHLILLNHGRVMYQGSTSAVPDYFGYRNHPNPPNSNIADWIMKVAQTVDIKTLELEGFFPEDERSMEDAFEAGEGKDALGITLTSRCKVGTKDLRPVGIPTQITLLFKREMINFKRDTTALTSKFGLTMFLGILIGIIFYDVATLSPDDQSNVQSRFGALIICLMMGMFSTAQDALLSFPRERPVFLREYSTNHYSSISYFLSRLTMEAVVTLVQILVLSVITFYMIGFQMKFILFLLISYGLAMASTAIAVALGSSVEDPKVATELLPMLFVPQMLFAGFFVATDLIPSWLRWAQYLCSLTYALRLMVIEEFSTCEGVENCDRTIDQIDADPDDTWWYWLVLVALFAVFRVAALGILTRKASKFY